jgi:hypothetical protein
MLKQFACANLSVPTIDRRGLRERSNLVKGVCKMRVIKAFVVTAVLLGSSAAALR